YSKCNLYVVFDSNVLVNVNILSILSSNQTKLYVKPNQKIQEINNILASKEFHLMNYMNYNMKTDEVIFQKLFKNSNNNNNNNSHYKRKIEIVEQQQKSKKKSSSPSDDEF
ncbi:unnamed protein product, partial [Rotaria sp. Silwood2]